MKCGPGPWGRRAPQSHALTPGTRAVHAAPAAPETARRQRGQGGAIRAGAPCPDAMPCAMLVALCYAVRWVHRYCATPACLGPAALALPSTTLL